MIITSTGAGDSGAAAAGAESRSNRTAAIRIMDGPLLQDPTMRVGAPRAS